jgi:2-methylcitrate dehydratase
MKDVIVAIVLAYEFEQRLCLFAKPGIRERKWHHATLTQFMMKNTVDPMAVQAGVFAALMAQKGFSGTEKVFEGKEGFMDAFIGWNAKEEKVNPTEMQGRDVLSNWSWDVDALVKGLGESYKILECGMKAFPAEALTHTHLSCVLKLMIGNNLNYTDIDEVRVTAFAQAYDILFDPAKYRPESKETADHSLPYCIAAAIVDKKITIQSFSEEKLKDPRINKVINKIKGEPSIEFEKMFPEKQPSKVVIKTNDGREFSEYLEFPKGDPREPMTMNDLENKFNTLSDGLLNSVRQKEIKDMIFNCDDMTASEFMAKLVV